MTWEEYKKELNKVTYYKRVLIPLISVILRIG